MVNYTDLLLTVDLGMQTNTKALDMTMTGKLDDNDWNTGRDAIGEKF